MEITLTGNPYSTNNIYFSGRIPGMRILKKEPKKQKESYKQQAYDQWKSNMLDCKLELNIKLYFGDKRKRDWDNYHKLAMDSLTGIVWVDDSQIQKSLVEKFYDKENPRIEIDIKEL